MTDWRKKETRGRGYRTMIMTRPEDYLESVIESSPVPIISLDTRFRVMMFNRSASELTGHEGPDITGRRVTRLVDLRTVREISSRMREGSGFPPGGMIAELLSASGDSIPVRLKISTLIDSEGSPSGLLIVASDLRELKRLNSEILEAERLAAITETAISVNHEINNPLCSILGNTQLILLEKDNLDPGLISKLEDIERQISRIQDIARRLGKITRPVLTDYVGGTRMLDMEHSEVEN